MKLRMRSSIVPLVVVGVGFTSLSAPPTALGAAATASPVASTGAGNAKQTDLRKFHRQQLKWRACGEAECARVKVPLSYKHTNGPTIRVGIARQRSAVTGSRSMLFNPGGPGGSGTKLVASGSAGNLVPKRVLKKYNIVGIDPRGVGRSSELICGSEAQFERLPSNTPTTKAESNAYVRKVQRVGKWCWQSDSALTANIGTETVAKDLDIVRAALGHRKLNYLGISYGTYLGTAYASQFPKRVRKFVLDAGLSAKVDMRQWAKAQARGFEHALQLFAAWCQEAGCIPGTASEIIQEITKLLTDLRADPLPVPGGRPVSSSELLGIMTNALPNQAFWKYMVSALAAAHDEDGPLVRLITDLLTPPEDSHNGASVNPAVNCYDRPTKTNATLSRRWARNWSKFSPTFGSAMAYSFMACGKWPIRRNQSVAPLTSSTTSSPVLLIGGANDPLTPFRWTRELAKKYRNKSVIKWSGIGHGAIGNDPCVDRKVTNYFLRGKLPQRNTTC